MAFDLARLKYALVKINRASKVAGLLVKIEVGRLVVKETRGKAQKLTDDLFLMTSKIKK